MSIWEMYSYNGPGGITAKRLYAEREQKDNNGYFTTTVVQDKTITYTYDSEGRAYQYVRPDGKQFTYTYDEMGRRKRLSEVATNYGLVDAPRNVQYNVVGQLKHLEYRATRYPTNSPRYITEKPNL